MTERYDVINHIEQQRACPDCGGTHVGGPDFEGFHDCLDCGAAWQDET